MSGVSKRKNESRQHVVSAFVIFGFSLFIAVIMMLVALVVWLSRVLGAAEWALLAVGGLFAMVALALYLFVIRHVVKQMRDGVNVIYNVARRTNDIYEWVMSKMNLLKAVVILMIKMYKDRGKGRV